MKMHGEQKTNYKKEGYFILLFLFVRKRDTKKRKA
jgi:hypothetical protein